MPYLLVISVKDVCNMTVGNPPESLGWMEELTVTLPKSFNLKTITDLLETVVFLNNVDDIIGERPKVAQRVLSAWIEQLKTQGYKSFCRKIPIERGMMSLVIYNNSENKEGLLANAKAMYSIDMAQAAPSDLDTLDCGEDVFCSSLDEYCLVTII